MPTLRRFRLVLAAGVTTGAAVWFTRARLDVFDGARGVTRVALFPPALELLIFVAGVSMVSVAAAALRRRQHGTLDYLLPLFALAALALPYLPVVADRLPILLVIAGRAKYLLWLLVGMQIMWALIDGASIRSAGIPGPSAALIIFVAACAAFGTAAWRLAGAGPFPGGDEPHYLIVAQSLWRDHDLQIENNHARRDYEEYFHSGLAPHFQARGANGAIYSIHPVGMPVVLAPVYAFGRYGGVVAFLVAVAALTSALMWQWVRQLTGSVVGATFAWAAVALTTPFLFGSFVVYPEMMAALCVVAAFFFAGPGRSLRSWAIAAAAMASLPWLSTKYAPMSMALAAVCLVRAWRERTDWRPRAAVITACLAISLAGWFTFFYVIWGTPLPSAPYGGISQMQMQFLAKGAPGLLFDQEYGIFAYAPVLLLGLTGLLTMWRRGGGERTTAIEIAVVFVALWFTVSAYELWWGGSSTPGRPLVAAIPLFAAPIARQHLSTASSARRAAHGILLVTSVWLAAVLVFAQKGLLVALGHTGTSPLLMWLSPTWHLWALAPSVFFHALPEAAAFVAVWLVFVFGSRLILDARPSLGPGAAGLVATSTTALALVLLSVVVPMMFAKRLQPDVELDSRARIDMLDDFDRGTRPSGVVYDPLRRVPAAEVPPLFSFAAAPGSRAGRQGLDLLLNARFALPAGRYRMDVSTGGHAEAPAGEIALQVGRGSGPITRWDIPLESGQGWQQEFALGVDAGFVGLVGSTAVQRAVSGIRIQPISIVDLHDRVDDLGEVLGAATYGSTRVYVYEDAWLEPTGFWTRGAATVAFVLAPQHRRDMNLIVRSARQNAVVLESGGWRTELELSPGAARGVRLPASTRSDGAVSVRVTSRDGFTPAVEQPGNSDQRFLGCWIEVRDE